LDYPNDFDTPVFPAGKAIAFSRRVSIWISCCFLLIIVLCCFLLYFRSQKSNYPFLVSIDPITDEWTVVAYPGKAFKDTFEQSRIIQEKLVNDFVTNWFTISRDRAVNESRWRECDVEDCADSQQFHPENINCALYCACDTKLFNEFTTNVLPEYNARFSQRSERWTVIKKNIQLDYSSENGSMWQVFAVIHSSVNGVFNVLSFVTVARAPESHPATLGYYVQDFNAYRIGQ